MEENQVTDVSNFKLLVIPKGDEYLTLLDQELDPIMWSIILADVIGHLEHMHGKKFRNEVLKHFGIEMQNFDPDKNLKKFEGKL
jgi:hypothetical protein